MGGDVGVSASVALSSNGAAAVAELAAAGLGEGEEATGLGLMSDVTGDDVMLRVAAVEVAGEMLLAPHSLELPGWVICG